MIPIETGTELGTIYINPSHVCSISLDQSVARFSNEFSRLGLISGESFVVEQSPEELWKTLAVVDEDDDSNPWSNMP